MAKRATEQPKEIALYVRLPSRAGEKLNRASEALGIAKKELVAKLVNRFVDPDSQDGLAMLGTVSQPNSPIDGSAGNRMGSYSFQAYAPPEVLNALQAAQLLQIEESLLLELARNKSLPGRQLGTVWRFSRTALIAWLSQIGPA